MATVTDVTRFLLSSGKSAVNLYFEPVSKLWEYGRVSFARAARYLIVVTVMASAYKLRQLPSLQLNEIPLVKVLLVSVSFMLVLTIALRFWLGDAGYRTGAWGHRENLVSHDHRDDFWLLLQAGILLVLGFNITNPVRFLTFYASLMALDYFLLRSIHRIGEKRNSKEDYENWPWNWSKPKPTKLVPHLVGLALLSGTLLLSQLNIIRHKSWLLLSLGVVLAAGFEEIARLIGFSYFDQKTRRGRIE